MKKQTILKSFLILLPTLAVGLALAGDSVTVFDTATGTLDYYSYLDLLPVTNIQMVLPLAAMLSLLSGILGGVYLARGKKGCLKGVIAISFLSSVCAVIPVLLRETVLVVPNVGLPIFMLVQCLLASYFLKKPQEQTTIEKYNGPRLK